MDNSVNMNNKIKNLIAIFSAIVFFTLLLIPTISVKAEGKPPLLYTQLADDITQTTATLKGLADPNGSTTTAWFQWGTSVEGLANETSRQNMGGGTTYIAFLSGLAGLSSNTTYYFRAVAQNASGTSYGSTRSFTTRKVSVGTSGGGGTSTISGSCIPVITTGSATFVTQNSATLRGLVNPRGRSTDAWFEYGKSFALTHRTTSQHIGSNFIDTDFIRLFPNLEPDTTYYFRAVAENICGINHGSILNFTTKKAEGDLPKIITLQPTSITQNSATLHGEVNPKNSPTTAWFEWGTDPNLNVYNSTLVFHVAASDAFKSVNSTISLLSANTIYYYRMVAKNNFGTNRGLILNFKTSISIPTPPPALKPTPTPTVEPKPSLSLWKETKNISSPNGTKDINYAFVGDVLEFSLNIKNEGNSELKNLIIKDNLSSYFDFIESNPKVSDESKDNSLVWEIDSVKSKEIKTISLKVKVKSEDRGAVVSNSFTAEVKGISQNSNNTNTILNPDLKAKGFASALGLSFDKLGPWFYLILIIVAVIVFVVFYMRHKISKVLKA